MGRDILVFVVSGVKGNNCAKESFFMIIVFLKYYFLILYGNPIFRDTFRLIKVPDLAELATLHLTSLEPQQLLALIIAGFNNAIAVDSD